MASKKNLVILLIMPFAVSLLTFQAISMTFNLIDNDIVAIDWDYEDNEAFALSGDKTKHKLIARAINDRNYPTAQTLKWDVYNVEGSGEKRAEIYESNGESYLHTLETGEVVITVQNDKGNVQKKMNATIYENNVIVFNSTMKGSQSNVDPMNYYGQYDLVNGKKQLSSLSYTLKAICEGNDNSTRIVEQSSNVVCDPSKNTISFISGGAKPYEDCFVKFGFENTAYPETYTYNFRVVTNGINVYTYDDLLNCTNRSASGEIMVLRKNFESTQNLDRADSNNTVLFGNMSGKSYTFSSEIYKFETRFNHEYIDQWNNFANQSNGKYKAVSKEVKVGLRVQKDVYGNGYTLNLHNLTYPYDSIMAIDQDGNNQLVPKLTDANLFRGPLPYYTLGDPNKMPLVTAYGQDNIGVYVEGKNITINDINLKNCDFGNNLANLDTVGTTMELHGDNITVKNSKLANGKAVLKSYDSNNAVVDNCMISYARSFLCMTGSYEYMKVNPQEVYQFTTEYGIKSLASLEDYLAPDASGDVAINNYLTGKDNRGHMLDAMRSIQNGLDNKRSNTFKGDLTIRDTLFYRSGISSIGLESLFNGPFLFNGAPSNVSEALVGVGDSLDDSGVAIPFIPVHISGVSYPVKLNLAGTTKFYDYKTQNIFDISGLVGENISKLAESVGYEDDISLDRIFPIKSILVEEGKKRNAITQEQMNVPIVYYGGGINYSTVTLEDDLGYKDHMTEIFDVDFLSRYSQIESHGDGIVANLMGAVLKSVTIVTGFNPFKFALAKNDGYLFGEAPQIQELNNNHK